MEHDLKIALTFSGQARGVKKCYEQIYEFLINKYKNIDIFAHTWNDAECKDINVYDLKDYIIEDYDSSKMNVFRVKKSCNHGNFDNSIKMFYSMNEVLKLVKKSEIQYDIIIRQRFDHIMERPFDMDVLYDKILNGYIIIPNEYCNAGGYNDQLALGSYDDMCKYLKTYEMIQTILDDGVMNHPESILKASLDMQKIKVYQYQHNFFDTTHAPLYYKYFN